MSVTFKDFEKISLKVGRIVAAEKIPGMSKILRVTVDIGGRDVHAIAGGAQYYEPDSFVGKNVIIVDNMEPKTIAGVRSEVMLLAADLNGKPIWLTVETDVPPGTKVR